MGLLTNWLYDRLKEVRPEQRPPVIDQSVHVHQDVRVFVGHAELEATDRGRIEASVREALSAASPTTDRRPRCGLRVNASRASTPPSR